MTNYYQNFLLKSTNSILIGIYLLLFSFVLKSFLDGFLSDTSMLGMMSIEIIEIVGLSLAILFVILSGFAVYFSNRRRLKTSENNLWNKASKKQAALFVGISILFLGILYGLKLFGFSAYLGVAFLLSVGLALILLNSSREKSMYLLAILCLSLAILTLLIPSYWYSALLIAGVGFIVYGIIIKKP